MGVRIDSAIPPEIVASVAEVTSSSEVRPTVRTLGDVRDKPLETTTTIPFIMVQEALPRRYIREEIWGMMDGDLEEGWEEVERSCAK